MFGTDHEGPEWKQRYRPTHSLTSAQMGLEVKATNRPLYSRIHCTGGWTGAKILAPTGIQSPGRPARSVSLYQLRYPGPMYIKLHTYN